MFQQIDFSKTYRIEPIPSRTHEELKNKGISSYPGTGMTISVGWDDTLKRYINTGLDINAPDVLGLPEKDKKKAQEWIEKQKKDLESLIGFPNWLDVTSDNWTSDLCISVIDTGNDLKIRFNDHDNVLRPAENYKDKIALLIIYNDENFPKSKHDIGNPIYRDAKFYLTTDSEVSEITKGKIKKEKEAYGHMIKLFDEDTDSKRAWEIAYYMGIVNKQNINADDLEEKMTISILKDKTGESIDKFLAACKLSNDILLVHNMLKIAVGARIVLYSPDGYYHRGSTNYRKTQEESAEYLLTPEMQGELAELREEVNKRKKKQNALA